jgi:hypothetical protein
MPLLFRPRGAAIQVVRSTPNATSGRTENAILGSLPTDGGRMPASMAARLTEAEKAEVDAYTANLRSIETMRAEVAIRSLNLTAAATARAMADAPDEATRNGYLAILKDTFQTVRAAIKAADKKDKAA